MNNRNRPSLIVLDNLPEDVPLQPYLPPTGRVHTIVTTRRQDLGHVTIRLRVLSHEEGVRLLNSGPRQFSFSDSVPAFVERLGGLPLALELARSYLNYRNDLAIPGLLEEMDAEGELTVLREFATEYRDQLPSRHELDVVRTFQRSWNVAPPK